MSIISLAEFGMANGGGDGGATILDLPSGALRSPFQFFFILFLTSPPVVSRRLFNFFIFLFITILDLPSGAVFSYRLLDFSKMYNSQTFLQLYSTTTPLHWERGRERARGRE